MNTLIPDATTSRNGHRSPTAASSPAKPFDGDLREQLADYKNRHQGLTNDELARSLGVSGTRVSKYLNGVPEGNVAEFEDRARDLLRAASLSRTETTEILKTTVLNQVANFCDDIRAAGKVIGVLTGDAGIGKTVAVTEYARRYSTAILSTVSRAQGSETGVRQLLWSHCPRSGYKSNEPRWDHLVRSYAGSSRFFIFDNAQRISGAAADLLCDFMDQTGCPIGLFGNEKILETFADVDQRHSRCLTRVNGQLKDIPGVVRSFLDLHCPEHADEFLETGIQIVSARNGGKLRTLQNVLKAYPGYLKKAAIKTPLQAFRNAYAGSVHTS